MFGIAQGINHSVVYCDTLQSVALHNGNARLLMTRLDHEGRPIPTLELILPSSEVSTLLAAIQKVSNSR